MNRRALKIVLLVEVLAVLVLSLYSTLFGIGALIGVWTTYVAIKILAPAEQKKQSINYNLDGWND